MPKETAVGTRLPREIYAKAMDLRETELNKVNPAALTPMDWIAFLLDIGIKEYMKGEK